MGSQKLYKGFAIWFSTFCENFVQVLKNYEDKVRKPLKFVSMSFLSPIGNGMYPSQSAPKVPLEPNKVFIFIMELYKLYT